MTGARGTTVGRGTSAIEWTEQTWNPVTGCSKVSTGCKNCYAEALSHRFGFTTQPWTALHAEENVVLRPERLDQPLRWQRPRAIFVNSMSDLFHELVPDEYIARVFAVMALAPRHSFQVLTKRPERMRDLLSSPDFVPAVGTAMLDDGKPYRRARRQLPARTGWPLPNVWVGTSIENRRWLGRADALRETPAAVRFISAEPLLGPLVASLRSSAWPCMWTDEKGEMYATEEGDYGLDLTGIDWLIAGGESGPGHRPMREEWVRDLRDACLATAIGDERPDTAFFFKQWGGARPKSNGRELDGRVWDEMPDREARA